MLILGPEASGEVEDNLDHRAKAQTLDRGLFPLGEGRREGDGARLEDTEREGDQHNVSSEDAFVGRNLDVRLYVGLLLVVGREVKNKVFLKRLRVLLHVSSNISTIYPSSYVHPFWFYEKKL